MGGVLSSKTVLKGVESSTWVVAGVSQDDVKIKDIL